MEPKMATMGKLDATSMAVIGKQLRLMYAEIIAEGVRIRIADIVRLLAVRSLDPLVIAARQDDAAVALKASRNRYGLHTRAVTNS